MESVNTEVAPVYDPNQEPVYDTLQLQRYLPHRFPFLLVDKVIEKSDTHIIGIKNVSYTEACFQGHFPSNPVYPGVLQIEALAQTGGILVLSPQPDPENWDTYFLKIDNTRFRAKVVPGDTMIMRLSLISPVRRGIVMMKGEIFVGDKLVSESELTAHISRRPQV